MLDLDTCAAMHTYLNGLDLSDDALGFDALAENGPGEHMFGSAHTMRHYETAYWDSALNDDQPYETWSEQGGVDAMTRANLQWKKVLADYQVPAIDIAIDEELLAFIEQKKSSMRDVWY